MQPIDFKESNKVLAKNQPQYIPLPIHITGDGMATSCWKLTLNERLRLLFTGKLWVQQLTFNKPLQPQRLDVVYPFEGTK